MDSRTLWFYFYKMLILLYLLFGMKSAVWAVGLSLHY